MAETMERFIVLWIRSPAVGSLGSRATQEVSKKITFFLCSFSTIFVYNFYPPCCKMATLSLGSVHFPAGWRMGRGRTLDWLLSLLLNLCLFIREKEYLPWDFCLYLSGQNWVRWLILDAKEGQKMGFYVCIVCLFYTRHIAVMKRKPGFWQ